MQMDASEQQITCMHVYWISWVSDTVMPHTRCSNNTIECDDAPLSVFVESLISIMIGKWLIAYLMGWCHTVFTFVLSVPTSSWDVVSCCAFFKYMTSSWMRSFGVIFLKGTNSTFKYFKNSIFLSFIFLKFLSISESFKILFSLKYPNEPFICRFRNYWKFPHKYIFLLPYW